jgi:alpha-beta hydrolase superfamily lysophospholipase
MSDQAAMVSDVVAGVPYVALPPAGWRSGQEPAPLIIAWHLNDPLRSAAAMASALPLAGIAAWRVYLDLPMHGRRQLPGGLEEFMRLGYQDAVLKAFEPQVTQAVDEFPAVLAGLRARLPVTSGPIAVVGASVGTLPAQLVMAGGAAQVSAAALISPVIQLAEVVAANERRFQVRYPWSDTSRAVAARFDFVSRAGEIAARDPQPAILLVTGAEDDPAFPLQVQRLQTELRRR